MSVLLHLLFESAYRSQLVPWHCPYLISASSLVVMRDFYKEPLYKYSSVPNKRWVGGWVGIIGGLENALKNNKWGNETNGGWKIQQVDIAKNNLERLTNHTLSINSKVHDVIVVV